MDKSVGLSRSNVSRYIQLATLFRRRIESGTWPTGQQIPTIDELVEEAGVARATVRQALGLLEAEGLLARYRGKGTFVLERESEGLWCEVQTEWKNLLTARPGAKIELLHSEIVPPPPLAKMMGTPVEKYRWLRRLHSRDGGPFLLADVYLDADLAKSLPPSAFKTMTALRMVENLPDVEIADAKQTLTISSADFEVSSMLDLTLNAPVAIVQRAVEDQRGKLILVANGIYRGDVVKMEFKLK